MKFSEGGSDLIILKVEHGDSVAIESYRSENIVKSGDLRVGGAYPTQTRWKLTCTIKRTLTCDPVTGLPLTLQEVLDWFDTRAGKLVDFIDWLNVTHHGYIVNPQPAFAEPQNNLYTVQVEYILEGE